MDKLQSYRLDNAYTDGVTIYLDNAPEVAFLVRLPSQYNRAYTQQLYEGMDISVTDGTVDMGKNLLSTRWAQEDAFLDHCLISMDGEPVPVDFIEKYPGAFQELMAKATDLVTALDSEVSESVKKSSTSSSGPSGGQAGETSISSLNAGAG